jgi:hypothetical protein
VIASWAVLGKLYSIGSRRFSEFLTYSINAAWGRLDMVKSRKRPQSRSNSEDWISKDIAIALRQIR